MGGGQTVGIARLTYLYYGYYAFYLIAILLTIGFLEREKNGMAVKKGALFINTIMAFLLGIVGIRMTVFLYVPMVAAGVLGFVKGQKGQGERNRFVFKHILILFVINVFGIIIGKAAFSKENILFDALSVSVADFTTILERLWNNIVAVLSMIWSTKGNFPVLSLDSISFLLKLLLTVLTVYLFKKNVKLYIESFIFRYFLSYLIIVLLVMTMTTFGEGVGLYYFLLPYFLVYILLYYINFFKKGSNPYYILIFLYIVIAFHSVFFYGNELKLGEDGNSKQMVEWLKQNSVNKIAATFWNAGVIEAYSDGKIEAIYLSPYTEDEITGFVYLNDKRKYDSFTNPVVILTDTEEASVLANKNSKLYTLHAQKIEEIGRYNVYQFFENPIFEAVNQ